MQPILGGLIALIFYEEDGIEIAMANMTVLESSDIDRDADAPPSANITTSSGPDDMELDGAAGVNQLA